MKKGIFYAVGVGPGDPELLTVKAVRILSGADCVAVPDRGTGEHTALNIVGAYVQEEQVWEHFGDMQEPGGYFTVVIVKE